MMLDARDRAVMKGKPIGLRLAIAGWAVAAVVLAACGLYFVRTLAGNG